MADYNLGTARGTIQIDYKPGPADKAREDVEGIGKAAGSTDAALGKVARGAGIAGAIIAGGLAVAVNSAANFEQRLSAIEAVSGATGKQMDALSDKALQLGKDTQFSATESATAMEELVKAGLTVEDVLNGAADATVNLAAAGEIAMPEAATIASNAMNQFGLAAEDMPKIADKIAGAANASAIDVSDFGMSLSQVGAVANLAGLSFDDTAVAIAEMGNAGIKGSDAGTSLKSMLSRLQPTTKKQAELMRELGITTEDGGNAFYDAQGKLKSLGDIQGVLAKSLKGMTQQQKQAALQTIFGSDAIRAAAILAENGADGYDKMSEAMGKVSAADVAATKMDNLRGKTEELMGSVETVGIQLGTILIPALTTVVEKVGAAVDWFTTLSDTQQQVLVTALAVAAGLLLATAALIKIVQFARAASATFKILGAAADGSKLFGPLIKGLRAASVAVKAFTLSLMTNPVFLIAAAIIGLVVALVLLYRKNEAFRSAVNAAWAGIKSAVGSVVDWFTGTALPAILAVWDGIVDGVQDIVSGLKDAWEAIKAVVSAVFSAIATVIGFYIGMWKAIITGALAAISAVWNAFWGTFGGIISAVWGLIVAAVQLYLALMMSMIRTGLALIQAVWSAVWGGIKTAASAVWGAIVAVVTTYLNILRAVITTVLGVIRSVVLSIWNQIRAVTSAVWNGIKAVIARVVGTLVGIVSGPARAVLGAIRSAWNSVRSATVSTWNGLVSAIRGPLNRAMALVTGIKNKVIGAFAGAGTWLLNAGKAIIQGLLNGIESLINNVTGKLKALTDKIPKVKGPERVDKKLLYPAGQWIMEGLDKSLTEGSRTVLANLAHLNADIPEVVNPALGAAVNVATSYNPIDAIRGDDGADGGGGSGSLQLVEGMMRTDAGFDVYVKGMAAEVDDDNRSFEDLMDRTA